MLAEMWPAVVFGWPGVVVAVALLGWGISRGAPWATLAGAATAMPFCALMAAYPLSRWLAVAAVLGNVGAVIAGRRGRRRAAVMLCLPFAWLIVRTASLVLAQ